MSTVMGGACVKWRQFAQNLLWESAYDLWGFKKKHWVDFYHYRVVVYTHCQDTFQFKHHVKVHFESNVPFKKSQSIIYFML